MKKLIIFGLVLGLTATALAVDKINIRKFAGLNTRINPYEIQDNESVDNQNFVLDKAGSLTERNLFQYYNSTPIGLRPIDHLYKFYKTSDAGYLIATSNGEIYKAATNALTSIHITTATVTSDDATWGFETFTDGTSEFVYAATNDYYLMRWNGTDNTFMEMGDPVDGDSGITPAEKCNLLKKHKARLFAAGSTEYPYRVYYSSLSDGDDWVTTGGTLDLPSYEKIMALEVLSDVLYIFTRTSIYALYGDVPDEFKLLFTRSPVGTHARKSVVLGDKVIFFLNKAGVFAFDGDGSVNISEPIQPTIDDISSTYIEEAASLYDKRGRYWLSYASQGGTFNDRVLVYDTAIKQWYELDADFASLLITSGGTDKGELYAGCSNNIGYLWQLQAESADEQLIHATKTQLETGVTFNTVFVGTETSPIVQLKGELTSDDDTKLLLHFNGTDGSTTFTDSSSNNHTLSSSADPELDTEYSKFGTASLNLDGNDYIYASDSDDWNVANVSTDNWTIECWVRHDGNPALDEPYIAHETNDTNYWVFNHDVAGGGLVFRVVSGGGNIVTTGYGGLIADDEWHHVAMCKVGSKYACYLDGSQVNYTDDDSTASYVSSLKIGYNQAGGGSYFTGNIDELRIINSNVYNANPVAGLTDVISINEYQAVGGTLISDNLNINASGQSNLGAITWNENLPTNTYIQFTTRTGTTDDTTYGDISWSETWVSASSVSIDTITGDVAAPHRWESDDDFAFSITTPTGNERDVLYYEPDDEQTPDCIRFTVNTDYYTKWIARKAKTGKEYGEVSAYTTIGSGNARSDGLNALDLSSYKFIGFWLKSDVTGDSVVLGLGETSGETVINITASTVNNEVWEKHWGSIAGYTSTSIDEITYLRITYIGEPKTDMTREIYLDEIWAYDFYDDGETITSTPNDWIQYRAMLGTSDPFATPQLIQQNEKVVGISYGVSGATTESEMISYWKSKIFDNNNEYNKYWQWVELDLESQNPTTNHTVSLDYYIDDDRATGTLTDNIEVTGRRVKARFYLPSGSYGKSFQFRIYDDDVDDELVVNQAVISFVQEG